MDRTVDAACISSDAPIDHIPWLAAFSSALAAVMLSSSHKSLRGGRVLQINPFVRILHDEVRIEQYHGRPE